MQCWNTCEVEKKISVMLTCCWAAIAIGCFDRKTNYVPLLFFSIEISLGLSFCERYDIHMYVFRCTKIPVYCLVF